MASLDTNVCLRKMQYLLLYILRTVLQFVYNGLRYVSQSDPDATSVPNREFSTSP